MSTENTLEIVIEPEKIPTNPDKDILDLEKSGDKLEIEDEEREKMLNEENKKDKELSEVEKKRKALEDAEREKEGTKRRIPTGGIKMPGFLRSRSRDKNKEGEEGDEGADLLEPPCTATTIGSDEEKTEQATIKTKKFTFMNPFSKKKKEQLSDTTDSDREGQAGEEVPIEKRPGFLNAIKLPLVSVIPRKLRSTKDYSIDEESRGGNGPAGLASMETLDDSNGSQKISNGKDEGMETVKLDSSGDEKNASDSEKADVRAEEIKFGFNQSLWTNRKALLIEHKFIACGLCLFILLLFLIIIIALVGPRETPVNLAINGHYVTAQTSCGNVEGVMEDGVAVFRGIPYALPPEGNRRWAPPDVLNSLTECWNGTLKVHNQTDFCWQIHPNGTINGSEDCLTLDIMTPEVRYHSPLPVVVLFGSETFNGGSPGTIGLPPPSLVRHRDVVFVRPNFRLGVLGFLAASALSQSVYPPTTGNYALGDAVAVLKWVQLNIQHFGGDSKFVTVVGYKAGATLITALLATRKVEDLFNQTWLSSGSAVLPKMPLIDSIRNYQSSYLSSLPCSERDLECLRKLDVVKLLDNVPEEWRHSVPKLPDIEEENKTKHQWLAVDGVILTEEPFQVFEKNILSVKTVIGTTSLADGTEELLSHISDWTSEQVSDVVRGSLLGKLGLAEEALRRYNSTALGLATMITDIRTLCPLLTLARKFPSAAFYVVTQSRDDKTDVGIDMEAILGHYQGTKTVTRRYVSAMRQIFFRFLTFGKIVPTSDAKKNKLLLIDQDAHLVNEYKNCDFWISKGVVPRYGKVD